MTTQRTLYGATIGLALLGALLRLHPRDVAAPSSSVALPPPAPAGRRRPPPPADTAWYSPIIAADVFSPTRTPPVPRFAPDQTTDGPRVAPPRRAVTEEPGIRLLGVSISPRGSFALMARDGTSHGTAIYRVGDAVAGGSVASITESTVVVTRARGPLVLRLPAAKKTRP